MSIYIYYYFKILFVFECVQDLPKRGKEAKDVQKKKMGINFVAIDNDQQTLGNQHKNELIQSSENAPLITPHLLLVQLFL